VDFDALPGASGTGLLRVFASDGVNTGEAVSAPFSVSTKAPSAAIRHPEDGATVHVGEFLSLEAFAFDQDDGFLNGAALAWGSPTLGSLGTGAQVSLPLLDTALGRHTIVLTVTDRDGNSAAASVGLTVDPRPEGVVPNRPPVSAPAADPVTGSAPLSVRFTANASDPDGDALTYAWDFGDGQGSALSDPVHEYAAPGTYTVQLTVTDGASSASATVVVVVTPAPAPQALESDADAGCGCGGAAPDAGIAALLLAALALRRGGQPRRAPRAATA
jgi:hypothetical protein